MFGWRKKRDGFEWRRYVKTTILIKRKKRREKLDEARQAALDNIVEAGRKGQAAGLSGLEAAKRGLDAAKREAGAAGAKAGERLAAGARVAGSKLGEGANVAAKAAVAGGRRAGSGLFRYSRLAGGKLRDASGAGIERMADGLSGVGQAMSPRVSLPLLIAGVAAMIGAGTRFAFEAFDAIAISATLIAVALIALAVLPLAAGRATLADPFSTRRVDPNAPPQAAGDSDSRLVWVQRGLAACVFAGAGAIVVWLVVQLASNLSWPAAGTSPGEAPATKVIEGKAKSLTGDTMLVDGVPVVLRGIEAPELRQSCERGNGRRWNCGRSALNALRRITGRETVTCTVTGQDAAGRQVSDCQIGETNIAAELVRAGHVFAASGFFASYGTEQSEAQEKKRGIWAGAAKRPAEFRAESWENAKADAPQGCPIKGKERARSQDKVYILPWSAGYDSYRVATRRGDRWFCSEEEALAAGWKPLDS